MAAMNRQSGPINLLDDNVEMSSPSTDNNFMTPPENSDPGVLEDIHQIQDADGSESEPEPDDSPDQRMLVQKSAHRALFDNL